MEPMSRVNASSGISSMDISARVTTIGARFGIMLIKPVRGFKSMPTAYATIKGFEVMRALRKGQAQAWCLQPGIMGEVRLVERAFGIGPSALTETMIMLNKHFANAA